MTTIEILATKLVDPGPIGARIDNWPVFHECLNGRFVSEANDVQGDPAMGSFRSMKHVSELAEIEA